jgi:phosphoribosylformylglycinamidine synthase
MKVETHNHPTAISPFPGAGHRLGGEIRDEARPARAPSRRPVCDGFSVSNLRIPGAEQPWEEDHGRPARIASALDIMLEGPIGAAAFNNEFGRPNLCGYFRTFEMTRARRRRRTARLPQADHDRRRLGNIRARTSTSRPSPAGDALVVLGGPAMLIGLGGGAASSLASRRRASRRPRLRLRAARQPEMQRRCQEVIDRCWQLGREQPHPVIHDVGAGGLSNALPELVNDAGRGGLRAARRPQRRSRHVAAGDLVQRGAGALRARDRGRGMASSRPSARASAVPSRLSARPWTRNGSLRARMTASAKPPIDMPMSVLFGKPPRMHRDVQRREAAICSRCASMASTSRPALTGCCACRRWRTRPSWSRSATAASPAWCARDQMVGPWQVPVADVAVTLPTTTATPARRWPWASARRWR